MQRAANRAPYVTPCDLARSAWDPNRLLHFNPQLSEEAVASLHAGVLEWLQLCVLEDKLERMCKAAVAGMVQEVERELQDVGRDWDVADHPQWLVFEVEQRLQIRRLQFKTAEFLMRSRPTCTSSVDEQEVTRILGVITQLNMGEGKTRVIIPMIVLEMAKPERLVRLHFLSQLLSEGYDYLHLHLTASLMCRRLCLLPFHRDVHLHAVADSFERIYQELLRCQRSGGVLIVAPEHRLSLQLKWLEMRRAANDLEAPSSPAAALVTSLPKLESLPYYDVLDESDEILRHKYQLIYAIGAAEALPSGPQRWVVAEAVLKQLQTSKAVREVLKTTDVAKRTCTLAARGAGTFDEIRLLPGVALDAKREELLRALCAAVLAEPPYPMRWLLKHSACFETITEFVTDPTCSLEQLEAQQKVPNVQRDHLLALRGLLACGLLEHCLSRRHRVDFGIDRRDAGRRKVAVPFRGSDTPAERAEYAQVCDHLPLTLSIWPCSTYTALLSYPPQPDTLIIFTLLAYYDDGLSRAEISEAALKLLQQGPSARKAEYDLWLESARPTMSEAQLEAIDSVEKLDLSSEVQLAILHQVYRHNLEAINYWLNSCVLPRETIQFPHRFVTNAWNLTDNKTADVIGFSGTKDNRLLLPLHVTQETPDEPAMISTDGKMLRLMLGNETTFVLDQGPELARAVIDLAVKQDTVALIDAGAGMAGYKNSSVANMIMAVLDKGSRLQGVIYFEVKQQAWFILDRRGHQCPLAASPIHERDAFVFFDESRCRGADMKLNADARATVTVGPDMCKDKIMQAIMRMRGLDRGQGAIFAVPYELAPRIRTAAALNAAATIKSKHLLSWVMHNTVNATAAGKPEWGSQGAHFCTTAMHPDLRLLDEKLELTDLYAGAMEQTHVYAQVVKTSVAFMQRVGAASPDCLPSKLLALPLQMLMNDITQRVKELGSDIVIRCTGLDEECERELETERELEREVERQLDRMAPRSETPASNIRLLLESKTIPELLFSGVLPLKDAVSKWLPELNAIDWSKCSIWVTKNFIQTVTTLQGAPIQSLGEYLRPVDV